MSNLYRRIIRFNGTIKDLTTSKTLSLHSYIKSKINFYDSSKQSKRIEKVDNLLKNCPEIIFYFEKYYNASPKAREGCLSEDYEICNTLSKLANYILYAPDSERITKKTKYNFYTDKEFWKKIKKEASTDEIAENSSEDNTSVDDVIDFLKRKTQNYKKQIKQVVLSKDLKKVHLFTSKNKKFYLLKDYQKAIDFLGLQLKKGLKEYRVKDTVENKWHTINVVNMRNSMIDDQILSKDKLNGTIYFKDALPESTEVHWDMFDFFDKEHVMALLRFKSRDSATDLDYLIDELESLLEQTELAPSEVEILNLYRKDLTIGDIGKRLDLEPHIITGVINKICNKVMSKYEENYEDWYYLHIVKGKYKRCSQCQEIKLVQRFNKDSSRKDGYMYICKKCESVGKNT